MHGLRPDTLWSSAQRVKKGRGRLASSPFYFIRYHFFLQKLSPSFFLFPSLFFFMIYNCDAVILQPTRGELIMVKGLSRVVLLLLFFITVVTTFAWGQVREVTIVYSNDINGQIDPVG
jgi:hypothetical protein